MFEDDEEITEEVTEQPKVEGEDETTPDEGENTQGEGTSNDDEGDEGTSNDDQPDEDSAFKDLSRTELEQELQEAKERITGFEEHSGKMADFMDQYPEFAEYMHDIQKGMSPAEAAHVNFGTGEAPPEGSEEKAKYDTRVKEREARIKEKNEQLATYAKYAEESENTIIEFTKDMNEKDALAFGDFVDKKSFTPVSTGNITKDFLRDQFYLMNREKDLAAAREEGIVKGKNEKHQVKKIERKKEMTNDGLPSISGGGSALEEKPKQERPWLHKILDESANRVSIFSRD